MTRNRTLITGAAFLAISLNGATFAFVGTSLPAIRTYLNIDIAQAALLTAFMQGGFTLAALIGGLLSDIVRREKVLMAGCLFLSIGSFLFGTWTSYPANIALILCIGSGVGFIVSSSNALLVEMYQERKGMILNIHHVFFGLGSLIAPLIMGSLLSWQYPWQSAYSGLSIIMIGLFLFFSITKLPEARGQSTKIFGPQLAELLQDRLYISITIISALAIGTQFALMLLSVTYLHEAKAISIANSSIILSLFFICLVLGRLICSRLSLFLSNTKIILALLLFQSAISTSIWLGDSRISTVSVVLSGFACSGLYPCFLALTGSLYFKVAGSALGILTTTAGLGGIVICWLTGIVSEHLNMQQGFIVPVLCSLMAMLLFALNFRPLFHKEELFVTA